MIKNKYIIYEAVNTYYPLTNKCKTIEFTKMTKNKDELNSLSLAY